MDLFIVKNPGALTTIQDLGRFGFLDRGVPPSGALDSFACRIANLLVGNQENMGVLEITVMGPLFEAMAAGRYRDCRRGNGNDDQQKSSPGVAFHTDKKR